MRDAVYSLVRCTLYRTLRTDNIYTGDNEGLGESRRLKGLVGLQTPTADPAPRLGLTRDWERENDGRNKTKRKEGLEENKPKGKRRKEMDRRKKQQEPTKRDGRKGKMAISGRGARTE